MPDDWEPPHEPEAPAWADWIFKAWSDLDGDREEISLGAGGSMSGRIPWTAIDRWARRYGVGHGDFEFLVTLLRAMDGVMIEHQRKRMSQQ